MYKSFLVEGIEQKVQRLIKKDGYAVFTDGQGTELYVTTIEDGYGYGLTNLDDDKEVNLKNDSTWLLDEETSVGDIAGHTPKMGSKMCDDDCDCDDCDDMSKKDKMVRMGESPVGQVGRTGVSDAISHVTPQLRAEFRKIVRSLGGKTVARQLLAEMNAGLK